MDEVLDGLIQTDKEKNQKTKNLVKYKYNKKFSVSQVLNENPKPGMNIPVQMPSLYTGKANEQQFVIIRCKSNS